MESCLSQRMLERVNEMFVKVLKLYIALSRPSINGTYYMLALVLECIKHGNIFKFQVSGKPVRIVESKLNAELARVTEGGAA